MIDITGRVGMPRLLAVCSVACIAVMATTGCGHQTYEQRLAESARYFAYLDKIEQSVAPAWSNTPVNPGPIQQLRVPLQFKEVRAPAPTKDPETGELIQPAVDPRQPDYMPLEYPGLVGTWEAPLRVVADSGPSVRKGYLYILTNAYMYKQAEEARRAPDFVRDLLVLIAEKLSLTPLDVVKNAQREQYPRAAPFYTSQKTYDVYRYQSDALVIDGVTYTIELYVQHAGPIDVVVVAVLPVGVDSQEKLAERIPYMLETLKVSSNPPLSAPKAGGGGTAPPPTTGF